MLCQFYIFSNSPNNKLLIWLKRLAAGECNFSDAPATYLSDMSQGLVCL